MQGIFIFFVFISFFMIRGEIAQERHGSRRKLGSYLIFQVSGSSELKINNRFYCQSAQLCLTEDRSFHLMKTAVFSSNGTQNRWYIKHLPEKKRIFGAIELSYVPFQMKSWKRLGFLQNTSVVNVEELAMNLFPVQLEINEETTSTDSLVNNIFDSEELLVLNQRQQLSSTAFQEETIPFSAKIMIESIRSLQRLPESSSLSSIFHCIESFLAHNYLQHELYQTEFHNLSIQLFQTNKISEKNKFKLFEMIFHQQLFLMDAPDLLSNYLQSILEFQQSLKGLLNLEKESSYFANLLFLLHLFQGKLSLWNFEYLPNNDNNANEEEKLVLTIRYDSLLKSRLLYDEEDAQIIKYFSFLSIELNQFQIYFEKIWSFYQFASSPIDIYSVPSDNSLPAPNKKYLFEELFQKYDYILKKITSFISCQVKQSSETKGKFPDLLKVNQKLQSFYQSEYHISYTNLILFNHMNYGLIHNACQYFYKQIIYEFQLKKIEFPLPQSHFSRKQSINNNHLVKRLFLNELFHENYYEQSILTVFPLNEIHNEVFFPAIHLFSLIFPTILGLDDNTVVLFDHTKQETMIHLLLTEPFLLNNFFMLLSQIMNPLVLRSNQSFHWIYETIFHRLMFVNILDAFNQYCSYPTHQNDCLPLSDEGITMMTRGLFLEAYQGVNLIEQFYEKYYQTYYRYHYQHELKWLEENSLEKQKKNLLENSLFKKLKDYATTSRFLQISQIYQRERQQQQDNILSLNPSINTELSTKDTSNFNSRKKKIGIFCYSLSRHSVGRLFAKIIEKLIKEKDLFEIFILTNQPHYTEHQLEQLSTSSSSSMGMNNQIDDITKFLFSIIPSSHWIDFSRLNPLTILPQLSLDILIYTDLLMQSSQYLFAYQQRFASIQIIFWGHPYTSSNPFIDYYISSSSFEPINPNYGRNHQFTEQLILFDSLSFQLYLPEGYSTKKTNEKLPEELSLVDQRLRFIEKVFIPKAFTIHGNPLIFHNITTINDFTSLFPSFSKENENKEEISLSSFHFYGILQSIMKMHPLIDEMIARLLKEDPMAIIVFLRNSPQQFHWQLSFQRRLSSFLSMDSLRNRIFFVNGMKSIEYSNFLCSLDVILDPFPFGGGVTMCDAIAGSCSHRRKNQNSNKDVSGQKWYDELHSIPYVTMMDLQSIHRIGVGIGKHIQRQQLNSSNLISIIEDHRLTIADILEYIDPKLESDESRSIWMNFQIFSMELIEKYAREAIRLAILSNQRFDEPYTLDLKEEIEKKNVFEIIYQEENALNEWVTFLNRVVS